MKWLVAKSVLFALLVPGTVAFWVPCFLLGRDRALFPSSLDFLRYFGWFLIVPGVIFLLWCFFDFIRVGQGTPAPTDPPKKLVSAGLYRFVRNPMYCAVTAILIGETLLFNSMTHLLYAAIVWMCFHGFVLFYEEPHLRKRFGEECEAYCRRVPRWIPKHLLIFFG